MQVAYHLLAPQGGRLQLTNRKHRIQQVLLFDYVCMHVQERMCHKSQSCTDRRLHWIAGIMAMAPPWYMLSCLTSIVWTNYPETVCAAGECATLVSTALHHAISSKLSMPNCHLAAERHLHTTAAVLLLSAISAPCPPLLTLGLSVKPPVYTVSNIADPHHAAALAYDCRCGSGTYMLL
eukprot:GHUV01037770.1.p2 GENE.GHUV01037770.1~~GHUV01037770.1.p2  ORF type:complete len:179 (-),score=19.31 GHUV01037770.1:183-719(-)